MPGAWSRMANPPSCASAAGATARCTALGSNPWPSESRTRLASPGPSLCDTAAMAPRFRRLRRIDVPGVASIGLGLALAAILFAYGYGVTASKATAGGVAAAAALLAVGGAGRLYASRLGAGGGGE